MVVLAIGACEAGPEAGAPAPPASASATTPAKAAALPVYGDRFAPPKEDQRRAIAIAVGGATSCAVLADGSVWCWGSDARGEIGWDMPLTHNEPSRVLPTRVDGVSGATDVAVTRGQGCAIVADGAVRCWGAKPSPDGFSPPERVVARDVGSLRGVVQLALGDDVGCAVVADDAIRCWSGVAGLTTPPTPVRDVSAAQLSTLGAGNHVCLRRRDGAVHCGKLDRAQLAAGTPFSDLVPMRGAKGVRDISLVRSRLCAVRDRGDVACWAIDPKLALGEVEPVVRPGPADVVQVSGTCARSASGSVQCEGTSSTVPAVALEGIVRLSADSHACAIDTRGVVSCWGANGWGQLANGRHTASPPAPISW